MNPPNDHISVCVCTFKRPRMLAHLLETLGKQETRGRFSYSIVVVDNDRAESARDVVERARRDSSIAIRYELEPEQNIALARNRALTAADGDFLAGIDDDEYADGPWLCELYDAAKSSGADGILGPVVPAFETPPPAWVTKGAVFERKAFPSGTILKNPSDTRCGNFLLSRKVVQTEDLFNPEFGKTGGEDVDFFKRMMERGFTFRWSQEAKVYETVPAGRLRRTYLLKRALLRGVVSAKRAPLVSLDSLKSVVAFAAYTAALPFLFVLRNRWFMRYLIKDCDHIGKVLARCGIKAVKERPGASGSGADDAGSASAGASPLAGGRR